MSFKIKMAVASLVMAAFAAQAQAGVIISEVDANGSSAAYAADWFELTNTGTSAVDITGWKMDDNSNSFASAVALRGVTSIGAGKSVVFIEGGATSTNDATLNANFINAWFGGVAPAGFQIGNYGGSGVGLSATSDAVNIFNSTGTVITRVDFNASTLGKTFDNAAGLNNLTISQLSAVGTNGAFTSSNGAEIGSPGLITAVPEPETYALLAAGLGLLGFTARRKQSKV